MFSFQSIEYLCDIIREEMPETRDLMLDLEFLAHQRKAREIASDLILKELSLTDLSSSNHLNVISDGN
jgi:hypothetical protein